MEPRKWKRMTGEQSLVRRNVLTNNGEEELFFKIKAGATLPAEELSHVKSSSKPARNLRSK